MNWEYRAIALKATGWISGGNIDHDRLSSMMNNLGREGWELTSSFVTSEVSGATKEVVVLFKRGASN